MINLCTGELSSGSSFGYWYTITSVCDSAADTYDESYISMAPSSASGVKSYWTGEYGTAAGDEEYGIHIQR